MDERQLSFPERMVLNHVIDQRHAHSATTVSSSFPCSFCGGLGGDISRDERGTASRVLVVGMRFRCFVTVHLSIKTPIATSCVDLPRESVELRVSLALHGFG